MQLMRETGHSCQEQDMKILDMLTSLSNAKTKYICIQKSVCQKIKAMKKALHCIICWLIINNFLITCYFSDIFNWDLMKSKSFHKTWMNSLDLSGSTQYCTPQYTAVQCSTWLLSSITSLLSVPDTTNLNIVTWPTSAVISQSDTLVSYNLQFPIPVFCYYYLIPHASILLLFECW